MLLTERPEPKGVRKRRGGWKAALPPPIPYRGGFECASVLEELDGELGLLAFQRARDVLLWTTTPPQHRQMMFVQGPSAMTSEAAPGAGDIRKAFRTLNRLVSHPHEASSARIAEACTEISDWASAEAYPETAVWFSEIAAVIEARNPQRAWHVGRALRQNAQYERSRQWLERAVGLARREGNRSVQGAAYLSLGNLEYHLGRTRAARKWWDRAWRLSHKFHLEHAGPAQHNLMTLCMLQGKFGEAEEHAAAAFELYDQTAPGFFGFAHDAAQLWSWQGFYSLAASVFEAVRPRLPSKEQFIAAANLARAAAGAGDRALFSSAWDAAEHLLSLRNEFAAEGLVSVAEGAQFLGLNSRASELAKRAESIARERRVMDTVALAEQIQERVRTSAPPPRPLSPPDHVRALANRLLRSLARVSEPKIPR
jgi:tetratricopeptide (TPR) repeat protein